MSGFPAWIGPRLVLDVSAMNGPIPQKVMGQGNQLLAGKVDITKIIRHHATTIFSRVYILLIYQPCAFRFNGTSYNPDFYDPQENVFFEIVGSRQAFHQNKKKIELFHIKYPYIKLEIIFDYSRG